MTKTNPLQHSTTDLDSFKKKILQALLHHNETIATLKDQLDHQPNGDSDTAWSRTEAEEHSADVQKSDLREMIDKQHEYIKALENALERIKNKTYGICYSSGNLIPKERLYACLTATRIIKLP